ncbi:MAG TPA: hypothetical protein VK457_10415, partial [Chloroflexota bacterium]|nr:hypothetical protein [Chloroflexota bacterium]
MGVAVFAPGRIARPTFRFSLSGMGLVFGVTVAALALVLVSLAGSLLASISTGAALGGFSLDNYARLLRDSRLPRVTVQTLELGLGSALVMLAFAFPLAWLLGRTDFRWKRLLFTLLTAKLAVPGFITAMAYVWLLNPTAGILNRMLVAPG